MIILFLIALIPLAIYSLFLFGIVYLIFVLSKKKSVAISAVILASLLSTLALIFSSSVPLFGSLGERNSIGFPIKMDFTSHQAQMGGSPQFELTFLTNFLITLVVSFLFARYVPLFTNKKFQIGLLTASLISAWVSIVHVMLVFD